MKIAVAATDTGQKSVVDPRFGRAKCFMMYDTDSASWESVDNVQNLTAAQGAGIQSAANVVNAGCNVLICSHCGPKAFNVLSEAAVAVYTASGCTAENAVRLYCDGKLSKLDNADVEGHW